MDLFNILGHVGLMSLPRCTAIFINFEQLFLIFQGCLEIEVGYTNYDLVVTARKRVRAYMYKINV